LIDERGNAALVLGGDTLEIDEDRSAVIADLHDALYGAKIISYAQGFMLLGAASTEYNWHLDMSSIAALWRAGCIIRSRFLNDITSAYGRDSGLGNLLFDDFFAQEISGAIPGLRRTVSRAALAGIPVPAYAAALAFYDSYRSKRLPANLTQAQRDYFGAHTYERTDAPRGEWFHTEWIGERGESQ
jgi:6-phosphogluconate dehydrogenase